MPFKSWFLACACLTALASQPVQAICQAEPIVQIDTLENRSVELRFDYSLVTSEILAKQMNFADTLTSAFLLDWGTNLYAANSRVMRVKIAKAFSQVDTLSSARDTFLACSDYLLPVAKGDLYRMVEYQTQMHIVQAYKGAIEGDTLIFRQTRSYPMTCGGMTSDLENPYVSLIGEEFLYFGAQQNEIPETGPIANYECQRLSGFWIDSLQRVHKLGRIAAELIPGKGVRLSQAGNSGVPGISAPLDSVVWAFNHSVASISGSQKAKLTTKPAYRFVRWDLVHPLGRHWKGPSHLRWPENAPSANRQEP